VNKRDESPYFTPASLPDRCLLQPDPAIKNIRIIKAYTGRNLKLSFPGKILYAVFIPDVFVAEQRKHTGI
jgi:hypothetical protein